MKVTIIAPGSRGDVQPYVALGTGLQAAGHSVSVLAFQEFSDLIAAHGLEFVDLGGRVEAVAHSLELEQGNLLKILSSQGRAAQQLAHQAAVTGLAACRDSDLIIAGLGGLFVGLALAEKLGVALVQAHLYPFAPTGEFPSVLTPLPQSPIIAWANGLSHHLAQQAVWQAFRSADNNVRHQVLQTARAPFFGPFESLQRHTRATLFGYSPQVLPPAKDWPDAIHVTGYWFLEPPAGWEPPAGLLGFLQSGPAPVYVGFGSMSSGKPEATADLALRALALAGRRGVLYSGWGGLQKSDLPETVFMVDSMPHSWLFPRMAAVVHHGGAGTTAAGLRAGVPAIVTPFFGDQPFWARQVHRLGVGPAPIPRRRLTADGLAESIRIAVSDMTMRVNAADLGERIRAEDGIARAVAIIERSA